MALKCGSAAGPSLTGSPASCAATPSGCWGPTAPENPPLSILCLASTSPSRGSARVFGLDTRRERARIRQGIGYMPENDSFIGNMNGVRFVRYMAELAGLPRERSPGTRARSAVLRRPGRSSLPQNQHLLAGHEAAHQAGPGAGARPAPCSFSTSPPTASIPWPASA